MKGPTTNPKLTGKRILRLKKALNVTYYDLGALFGVRPLTVSRWAKGHFAPRLIHQRTLAALERTHKEKLNG